MFSIASRAWTTSPRRAQKVPLTDKMKLANTESSVSWTPLRLPLERNETDLLLWTGTCTCKCPTLTQSEGTWSQPLRPLCQRDARLAGGSAALLLVKRLSDDFLLIVRVQFQQLPLLRQGRNNSPLLGELLRNGVVSRPQLALERQNLHV